MLLVDAIRDGIIEAFKSMSIGLINWASAFLDQFLLFILLFIILANVMGYKDLNKFTGLFILLWIILKAVVL